MIAVVGNDAGWTQIAREQVEMLGDDVGTRAGAHRLPRGRRRASARAGLLVRKYRRSGAGAAEARQDRRAGPPVLLNVHLGRTDFRKGSISM